MAKLRQSKHFVTVVCLILGAVLLCSAAVANIGNAGGYQAYKKGLFGLLNMDDYSGHGYVSLEIDGVELIRYDYTEMYNRSAAVGETVTYSRETASSDLLRNAGSAGSSESWKVVNPDDFITKNRYTSYIYDSEFDAWTIGATDYPNAMFGNSVRYDTENEHNQKVMRVVELLLDMFVGDLKNNFIYVGTENGLREYRISLSGDQLPEIVQAVLSLAGDSSTTYNLLWGSGSSVISAIDFNDDVDISDGDYWERYSTARENAWNVVNDHDGSGVAVINRDLSIDWYPSQADYVASLGKLDLIELVTGDNAELLFAAIKGEPKISGALCDLAVDREGRLMRNLLRGTVDFRLVDNTWHSATLSIFGEFDSRDENVVIPLPVVNPMAASIVDHSRSCEANSWEFTVSDHGKVETYHRTIEATSSGSTDYGSFDWYLGLDPFFKLNHVGEGELSVKPADSTPASEKVVVYEGGEWVERSEFDDMCEQLFGEEYYIREFADNIGVAPYALSCDLLWAYEQLTGEEWDGPLYDFTHVNSATAPENEYLFDYTPVDRILTLAARCGYEPTLRYSSGDIPEGEVYYMATTRAYSGKTYGCATIYVTADEMSEAMSVIQRAADADELPYLEEYNLYPDELIRIANDAYWNSLTTAFSSDGFHSSLGFIGGAVGPTQISVSPLG